MKRILTAVLLAPAIVYTVLWAPEAVFLAVLAAVALFCFYEYDQIVAAYGIDKPGPIGFAAGIILLFARHDPGLLITLLALLALGVALGTSEFARALPRAGALLLGVVYIFGVWRCAIPLRGRNPYWLLFALALSWVADIAAYYVGSRFGRHKLAPRISPGKSWEGAVASLAGSLAFGVLYLGRLIPSVPLAGALAAAAAGNVAGQIGDLAESALKRGAGVKDSGAMLPGHGGWLDRVDSSLFAVPVVYWMVYQMGW